MAWAIEVAALPMSICPHAMLYFRPSREVDFVRPVMACLVAVYGAEFGLGLCAEMDPLLMILPPCGVWAFMRLNAACVHRKAPVRLVLTTPDHSSKVKSSSNFAGAAIPALLN